MSDPDLRTEFSHNSARLPKLQSEANGTTPITSLSDREEADRVGALPRPQVNINSEVDREIDFSKNESESSSGGGLFGWFASLGKWLIQDGGILEVVKFIGNMGLKFLEGIWDFAKSLFTKEFWENAGEKLKNGFQDFLKNPFGSLWTGIKALGNFALDTVIFPFKTMWQGLTLIAQGKFTEGFALLAVGIVCTALLVTGVNAVLIGPILASRVLSQALARGLHGVLQTGVGTIAKDIGRRVAVAWVEQSGLKNVFNLKEIGNEIAENAGKGARETAISLTESGLSREAVEDATIQRFKIESRELMRVKMLEILDGRPETASSAYQAIKDKIKEFNFKRRNGTNFTFEGLLDAQVQNTTLGTLQHLANAKGSKSGDILLSAQKRLTDDGISVRQQLGTQDAALAVTDIGARLNQRGALRTFVEAGVDYYGADLLNRASQGFLKKSLPVGKHADEMDNILKTEFFEEINEQLVNEIISEMEESFEAQARIELAKIADEFAFSDSFVERGVVAGKDGLREGIDEVTRPLIKESLDKAFRRFRPIIPRAFPNLADPVQRAMTKKVGVPLVGIPGGAPVSPTSEQSEEGQQGSRAPGVRLLLSRLGFEFGSKPKAGRSGLTGHQIHFQGADSAEETNDGISDEAAFQRSGMVSAGVKRGIESHINSSNNRELVHRTNNMDESIIQDSSYDTIASSTKSQSFELKKFISDMVQSVTQSKGASNE